MPLFMPRILETVHINKNYSTLVNDFPFPVIVNKKYCNNIRNTFSDFLTEEITDKNTIITLLNALDYFKDKGLNDLNDAKWIVSGLMAIIDRFTDDKPISLKALEIISYYSNYVECKEET